MTRLPDPTVPLGGLKHAINLLGWWVKHHDNKAFFPEIVQQSKECRRELAAAALQRFEKRRTP